MNYYIHEINCLEKQKYKSSFLATILSFSKKIYFMFNNYINTSKYYFIFISFDLIINNKVY